MSLKKYEKRIVVVDKLTVLKMITCVNRVKDWTTKEI